MTKVVYRKIDNSRVSRENVAVGTKLVRSNGRSKTLLTLDLGSESFGDDLRYVFTRNVAKARRENKRLTGAPDVAISKL